METLIILPFIIDKILQLKLFCVTVLSSSCLAINMTYYLSLCPTVLTVKRRGGFKVKHGRGYSLL